jgi:hypothetical protein
MEKRPRKQSKQRKLLTRDDLRRVLGGGELQTGNHTANLDKNDWHGDISPQ